MREIKFRAWEKNLKAMISVDSMDFKARLINMESAWRMFEEIEIMQYTGLKDKNGVEIYEGDIVEIKDHSFQKKPGDYTGIEIDGFYPVTYTERMELVAGQWLLMHQLPYINVVGNIYENPELLEESAE